jgi:hypothetical protein
MLFLISSAPDTKEFKTAYKLAKDMSAEICLLQNAVLQTCKRHERRNLPSSKRGLCFKKFR